MNKSTKQELKRFQQIYGLMFVKDSKTVVLMKKGRQHDAEEEKENIIQGFLKNILLRGLIHQNPGKWIRFMLIKVEIHT
jgi:hypothetical protein